MIAAVWVGLLLVACAALAYDFWWRFPSRFVGTAFMQGFAGQVFLTYDDGPSSPSAPWGDGPTHDPSMRMAILDSDPGWDFAATTTANLARVLRQYDARAIFFVRGDVLEADVRAREMAVRLRLDGHVIGNHSHSHNRLAELSPAQAVEQIGRAHKTISAAIGAEVPVFRPPYGQWHVGLTWRLWRHKHLRHYGLPVGWSHATRDWEMDAGQLARAKIEEAVDRFIDAALRSGEGAVSLQHDVWIYAVLFTRLLLERLEGDVRLRIGQPADLVRHVQDVTSRAGPWALGFYFRDRLQRVTAVGRRWA